MRKHLALMFLATFVAIVGTACLDLPGSSTSTTVITNTNTNTQGNPPAPSGSPSPGVGQGVIRSIKVTFIDGSPGAGDKTLTVGEKGTITATPLDANGVDPCKGIPNSSCVAYTQADIAWSNGPGVTADCSGVVQASDAGEEAYNLDLKACNPGTFTVYAVFKGGLITGSLAGTVIAP